ncbi:hypothetical protein Droror1_Dr00020915 [Drosera rotundifolia]
MNKNKWSRTYPCVLSKPQVSNTQSRHLNSLQACSFLFHRSHQLQLKTSRSEPKASNKCESRGKTASMASEFIAKTTILNLSRTLPRSPCRISQATFSSAASKTHQDQHARNHAAPEPDAGPEAERRAEAGAQRAANVPEKKAREMEERYGELKETTKEKAPGSLSGEEAREGVQSMADEAREETKSSCIAHEKKKPS